MEDSFCVYKHTSPNGKVYIGITCQKPSYRWSEGNGYKNNVYFYRAIQKYGWESFQHEVLFTGLSKENARKKEVELIKNITLLIPSVDITILLAAVDLTE